MADDGTVDEKCWLLPPVQVCHEDIHLIMACICYSLPPRAVSPVIVKTRRGEVVSQAVWIIDQNTSLASCAQADLQLPMYLCARTAQAMI